LLDAEVLAGVEDKAPVRNADQNPYEAQAYYYVLARAKHAPVEALAKAARRDPTYAHLFEEPAKYRGQIVHLEGRLRRLRQFDTSRYAAKLGVPVVYEAWVFDERYFGNPYCLLITSLPAGLAVGEQLDRTVAFDGYFFKRYRYKAGDGLRDAPLLIGPTLIPREAPAVEESPWSFSRLFLPLFLSFILGTVLLAVILGWWFRRGDRSVRARLDEARMVNFGEPP
jgi:hypothetical protein